MVLPKSKTGWGIFFGKLNPGTVKPPCADCTAPVFPTVIYWLRFFWRRVERVEDQGKRIVRAGFRQEL